MPLNQAVKGPAKIRAFRRERNAPRKSELFDYLEQPMGAARVLAQMDLSEPHTPAILPKLIWMYWHDGWDNAPEVVKLCRQSWILRNPGYEVRALDYRSLSEFLPDPPVHYEATKLNSFANRVRLRLLRTYGGVWADATNFCAQAIDPWIKKSVIPARLFAFSLPNADRPVATWFLAAATQSPLAAAWEELVSLYFEHIMRESRRAHAYFFMPYTLEFALLHSPALRAEWGRMPTTPVSDSGRVSALAKLQTSGDLPDLKPERWEKIAAALTETRMQKLTWKGAVRENSPRALRVLELLRNNLQEHP